MIYTALLRLLKDGEGCHNRVTAAASVRVLKDGEGCHNKVTAVRSRIRGATKTFRHHVM